MNERNFSHGRETDSPGDVHFHYNRAERLRYLNGDVASRMEGAKKKKGIFRGNRALLILLLDILFILLLYFILTPILNRQAKNVVLEGYSFQLTSFEFEDKILFSLKVKASGDIQKKGQTIVDVVFSTEKSDAQARVSDLLPREKGKERIIRGQLRKTANRDRAIAEIEIDGKKKTLRTEIRPE